MKQREKLPAPLRENQNGSTIIGVLAATVFIGIVATFMVKNTGSQSQAGRGYSTLNTMSSTANSGMFATETHIEKNGNTALKKLFNVMANTPGHDPFLIGKVNKKHELSGRQFVSSKIKNVYVREPNTEHEKVISNFEVDAGRNEQGKALKKAVAFYNVSGAKVVYSGSFGSNAFYMAGDFTGSAQFAVKGNATFMGEFKGNAADSTKFLPENDSDSTSGVYFAKNAVFDNAQRIEFQTKAYFAKNLQMQNPGLQNKAFKNDFGVRDTFKTSNGSGYNFGGDVWLGGRVTGNPVYRSDNSSGTLYHTSSVTIPDDKIVGFETSPQGAINDIPTQMGMDMSGRTEPNLSLDAIKKDTANYKFLSIADVFKNTSVTGKALNTFIKDARANPAYNKCFYNDHLLVNWDKSVNFNTPNNPDDKDNLFNEKVMFNVTANINASGNFYNSVPDRVENGNVVKSNASTLIFTDQNAQLLDFGCRGLFRGLIYVPEGNTTPHPHTFKWGVQSSVDGAVIMQGNTGMNWNGGGALTTITRNGDILNSFVGLIEGGGPQDIVIAPNAELQLKPLGFYYY